MLGGRKPKLSGYYWKTYNRFIHKLFKSVILSITST